MNRLPALLNDLPARLHSYVPLRLLSPTMLACTILLGGCAAQTAYREGRELASTGKTTEALSKFEQAAKLDNTSAQYRIATIQTREALVAEAVTTGERALDEERLIDARNAFNRGLALQANNSRALDGLKAIDAVSRHEKWLLSAQQALSKKDEKNAQMWARMVTTENPRNAKAQAILQGIAQDNDKPSAVNVLSDAYRKPITIEFKDAPLKTVFEVISRSSGLNFLFDKEVKTDQKTSIFLKNSNIEAAVNLTLLTNQLEQRVLDANTVLIFPNTQAKQKDYQQLTVKAFYLVNAEAKNVATTLKTILKTRDVVVDDKLNMLILRDSPEAIRLAEKLVALHDVAEPEVMLEVEILEVKRTRLLDLGVRWPDQLSLSPLGSALTVADLRKLNQDNIGATIGSTNINAKKIDTDANILANPRIRARNREKAKILIGERVPNITSTSTSTGFVAESVNYVDVGLKLDVEPTIYLDGEVAIKVSLEVSNIISQLQTKAGSVAYQIGTRTAQTVLRLKDGENQVLAGLINDEDRRTANKVPSLGEIPIVGRLFGNQADDSSKTEIILSITPRILRNVVRPAATTMEFESGTETSLGSRSASGGSTVVSPQTANSSTSLGTIALPAVPLPSSSGNPITGTPLQVSVSNTQSPLDSPNISPIATSGAGVNTLPAATGAAAQLRWQGPTALKVGDTFAVQLMMLADQPIVSIPLAIGFDPRALQVVSVTEGDFLKQNGAQTSFTNRIDPNGQILMTGTRAGESGATALGAIATINLRVLAATAPETRLQLLTISPIVLGGRGIASPLPLPHVITLSP
jgi:general secretion pathway protein D